MLKRAAILALVICAPCASAQNAPAPALQRIDYNDLCVTNGAVSKLPGGRLAIATPSSRAVVRAEPERAADQVAEIRFRYLGPTPSSKPLASGELRRQIGLKLRAQDTCNLLYAMWHIEPDARIAVSIKRNAGMDTHAQCGAGGYVNFKSEERGDLPPIRPGEAHTLRAELHGNDLTVTADGKVAWQGGFGNELPPLSGPPGLRTDNGRFELEYLADGPTKSLVQVQARRAPSGPGRCEISDGD
ncbi:MAG TPA: hypothetical protein VGN55_25975 [Xanthobacteraceae bacterium]